MLIVFSEHGYHPTVALWKLFFEVVFPSPLPFFILSDVSLSTGMAPYLGVWFEPLMHSRATRRFVCVFSGTSDGVSHGRGDHGQGQF